MLSSKTVKMSIEALKYECGVDNITEPYKTAIRELEVELKTSEMFEERIGEFLKFLEEEEKSKKRFNKFNDIKG